MKTKKWMAALAVIGTTIALAGCSSSGATSTASTGTIKLSFWEGYTASDGVELQKLVKQFNASQKQIQITMHTKTWAVIGSTVLPALAAKNGPDILASPPDVMTVYASQGVLQPLTDFYSKSSNDTASINQSALQMSELKGTNYAVPLGFVPLTMFYNKAEFATAGITTFPKTWDEWIADAKKLTIQTGTGTPSQYGLALPDHQTVGNGVWTSLFESGGGDVIKNGNDVVINSAANKATLSFFTNAVTQDHISPIGLSGIDADNLFTAGKAAMEAGGPWLAGSCTASKIDCGIAPIPAGPSGVAESGIGVTAGVTSQASPAKKAAAETFFAWFFKHNQSVAWALGSGWPPLNTTVSASEVSANSEVQELTEQSKYTRPLLPGVVNQVDVITALDTLTQKAFAGGDIPSLLSQAEASMKTAVAK
jgi:multiple sugar transport system substrate-binding protein